MDVFLSNCLYFYLFFSNKFNIRFHFKYDHGSKIKCNYSLHVILLWKNCLSLEFTDHNFHSLKTQVILICGNNDVCQIIVYLARWPDNILFERHRSLVCAVCTCTLQGWFYAKRWDCLPRQHDDIRGERHHSLVPIHFARCWVDSICMIGWDCLPRQLGDVRVERHRSLVPIHFARYWVDSICTRGRDFSFTAAQWRSGRKSPHPR